MATRFDTDTAVRSVGEGVFEARISSDWFIGPQPNGGYVAAIVLRAMVATVDDASRPPRSYTVHLLRPAAEGPVRVSVTVERSGRTVSTLSARLEQDGRLIAVGLCAFGVGRGGDLEFADASMPSVPPPSAVEPRPFEERHIAFRQQFDNRWVIGEDGSGEVARTGAWLRLAEGQPLDAVVVTQLMDCWMPSVFVKATERGKVHGPNVPTIELTVHFREPLPLPDDHYLGVFHTDVARDGFLVEDGRLWAPDGRLVADSRQLAIMAF